MIDSEALGRIFGGEILPMIVGLWFGWRYLTSAKHKSAIRKMFGMDDEELPEEKETLTNDDSGIAYGGIAVMITVITAMVAYIALVPVYETIYPFMTALDPTNHHATMNARINTGWDLWLGLPVWMIAISVIFFVMRTIRRQAYSREFEEEYR